MAPPWWTNLASSATTNEHDAHPSRCSSTAPRWCSSRVPRANANSASSVGHASGDMASLQLCRMPPDKETVTAVEPPLEPVLQQLWRRAHAAWPTFALAPELFKA